MKMAASSFSAPGARDALAARFASLDEAVSARLRATLLDDMVTEYDARFLIAFLESLPVDFSAVFRETLGRWRSEEETHYAAFRAVCGSFTPDVDEAVTGRCPDFRAIEHLFSGEFEILCLLAYDELATVRGYTANLALYDVLGAEFATFIRGVVADEAAHYAGFRRVLRECHPHRCCEAPEVIRQIRAADGNPYQATFVLDHDDPVYGSQIFDDAARVLTSQLARGR